MTSRAGSKIARRSARRAAPHALSVRKGSSTRKGSSARKKWSRAVTEHSDALDLRIGVFKLKSAQAIARSLKRSAEASQRRKSSPFRSAMSMLNFEINRAGTNLSHERRAVLSGAKIELRKLFDRSP